MPTTDAISTYSSLTLPLPSQPSAMVGNAPAARVKEMSREFEATFLSMILKEMRQTLEPDGLFPGDSGDIHGGLFDLYLGRHLADSGGVGMTAVIERQTNTTDAHLRTADITRVPRPPAR